MIEEGKESYHILHGLKHTMARSLCHVSDLHVALVATPRSYSWSANVCGRKEWLLYPPGEEELLRSHLGNLPFDITSQELEDRRMFPNAGRACRPIRVIQGPGEVIFVPR